MNKKFASLGTALSREQAKKVMGGNSATDLIADDGLGGSTICACDANYNCICGSTNSCSYHSEQSHCLLCNGKTQCP